MTHFFLQQDFHIDCFTYVISRPREFSECIKKPNVKTELYQVKTHGQALEARLKSWLFNTNGTDLRTVSLG